jgi:hypothetical protein
LGQTESWLEPNLQDVMLDPIVQLVMRRDGLTPELVWLVIRATSAHLRGVPGCAAEVARTTRAGTLAPQLLRV